MVGNMAEYIALYITVESTQVGLSDMLEKLQRLFLRMAFYKLQPFK